MYGCVNDLCSGYYYNTDNLVYSIFEAYMCAVIHLLFLFAPRDGELTTTHPQLIPHFSLAHLTPAVLAPLFLVSAKLCPVTGPLHLPYLLPGILPVFLPMVFSFTQASYFMERLLSKLAPMHTSPFAFHPLGFPPQNFPQHDIMLFFRHIFFAFAL